jgi:hypothetical protein
MWVRCKCVSMCVVMGLKIGYPRGRDAVRMGLEMRVEIR